jgi:predicted nuclease of predicted toxin-antitoxin system
VRLLFDQNLSPALPRLLADIFPDSKHTEEAGLGEADDGVIWAYAIAERLAIVSKDADFRARSMLEGSPPQVIWLKLGNCPTKTIIDLLRINSVLIHSFGQNPAEPLLILEKT